MSEANLNLKALLMDIFMMEEALYADENGPQQIEGWDSLATVSMAVALQQEFNHHMTIDEVIQIHNIGDIKNYLRAKGVDL